MNKSKRNHDQNQRGEFLHNYYTFESVHDGYHDSVVRIFIGLFCKLWHFFNLHHQLHYITWNNSFPTRSV